MRVLCMPLMRGAELVGTLVDGCDDGWEVGEEEGCTVGWLLGRDDGCCEGCSEGRDEG